MGDANIWRLVYRGLCDLLVNMGAWEASLSTGAVGHLQAGRRIKEALPNVERLLAMVAQEIVDGQIDRPVAEAGALRVQWNHDGAGQPTRIVSVTVGNKRFVPDASVTDTDDWAADVVAAENVKLTAIAENAKLVTKGDVRAPPKQNTLVDDLLWAVFMTADSSDLWGHARREADIFRSAVRQQLMKHGVDTNVWSVLSSAQAASVVALEAEVERLRSTVVGVKAERRLDGEVYTNESALRHAEIARLNGMLDENRRVIASRDAEIERLNRMLDGRDEGIPLNELPADLRADMQAMDVAEAKNQLASDEGLKVARVLVAKLRKKYDQDVVQGIVDDLIRTKQTGAGLHGLSPGEKEFVCLSRVHIADDPTPRIPVFFSVGLRASAQDEPAVPSAVDHPAHYIARAGKKDATKLVKDLQKAVWYLRRRIEQLGGADDANTASLVRRLFEIYDRPCKPDGSWEHVAEYEAIEKKVRVLVGAPPSKGDK